jgi:hypothetical protein
MTGTENAAEALRMVSDWAKWLVTIETFAIAVLGTLFTTDKASIDKRARAYGTAAVVCFVASICFAAMLLLTLPEIAQTLRPDLNIWLTEDSVAGDLLGLNTQGFALIESLLFGCGILFSAATIITIIWSGNKKNA